MAYKEWWKNQMTKKQPARVSPLSRSQIFEIGKHLEEHLEDSDTQKGRFRYKGDWDDEKLATLVGCGRTQIAKCRNDLFGELERGANGININALVWDRLKALEARVEELEKSTVKAAKPSNSVAAGTPQQVLRDFQGLRAR